MNKQQAIEMVRDTFESPFEIKRFTNFIKNLLNHYDDAPFTRQGSYIPDQFEPYISKYERIGKYSTGDQRIDILIVYLKKESSIERARSMQRNFIAGYLQGKYGTDSDKDAALVAFVSSNGLDWRFSLVKLEVRLEETLKGRMKPVDEFTPVKRWSFLVGSHEKSHTAQRQFQPILEDDEHDPTLVQLEEAFNIETVTKEFFIEYRRLFIWAKEELDKAVVANPKTKADFESKHIDTVNLAKKLLGQIVFLYYLQKKGWFGVPRDAVWGEGSKNFLRKLFEKKHTDYQNFFNDILEPLFYEALRIDRSYDDHYYSRFNCKIPFLNGGLFDPMNNYDWVHTDIHLPNDLFSNKKRTVHGDVGDGILDIFDRYNFTVKEDEPFEKEVAIDPELLGKAYEKFNAIRPDNFEEYLKALKSGKKGEESKFNKQYGVYYTPREIVHYMCQQCLINFLATELDGKASKLEIGILVLRGEQIKEHDARVVAEGRETKDYSFQMPESIRRNAAFIDEKLASINVCDPAVGSGAFPVGMMSEIVKARMALTVYRQILEVSEALSAYHFKRECIENSLYGVDIDSGAVEIAKLRLWLSLVVDEDDPQNIKPLPNLDYKIVCGNSLVGFPFKSRKLSEIENLKHQFFYETRYSEKVRLKSQIDYELSKAFETSARSLGYTVDFDFEFNFSEVFHHKNGFDIVIANPPYVGQKGYNSLFQKIKGGKLGKFHQRRMDLFYFFFHLALDIGKQNSSICFITTNYFTTATYADKLRKDIKNRSSIIKMVNFNELKIFESALGQHSMITVLQKGYHDNIIAETSIVGRNNIATPEWLDQILNGIDNETTYHSIPQIALYDGDNNYIRLNGTSTTSTDLVPQILNKIKNGSEALEKICSVIQGIVTGADKLSPKHLLTYGVKGNVGEGIFVLSQDEIRNIKPASYSVLKPWFKNSDISKWITSKSSMERLIYYTSKNTNEIDPAILKHFKKYKNILINRNTRSGTGIISDNDYEGFVNNQKYISYVMIASSFKTGKYYCVSYARDQKVFDSPKIVAPQRSPSNIFGYNETPWYASADVYFISQKDESISLKYVLALLNSKLYFLWLYHRGKRKGESLELYQKPLSEIPIKKISEDDQKLFIRLVDHLLAAKNANPQTDISAWEKEIDQLVYQLYELTEDEIKIVESSYA